MGNRDNRIIVYLDKALKEKLDKLVEEKHLSRNEVCVRAIESYVKRFKLNE